MTYINAFATSNDTLLNKENDTEFSKTFEKLKKFLELYDVLIEEQEDLKEKIRDIFQDLKEKEINVKILKKSLKERKERLYNKDIIKEKKTKTFFDIVLQEIDEKN